MNEWPLVQTLWTAHQVPQQSPLVWREHVVSCLLQSAPETLLSFTLLFLNLGYLFGGICSLNVMQSWTNSDYQYKNVDSIEKVFDFCAYNYGLCFCIQSCLHVLLHRQDDCLLIKFQRSKNFWLAKNILEECIAISGSKIFNVPFIYFSADDWRKEHRICSILGISFQWPMPQEEFTQ